ncbi:MAG TPA: hypothetical protein VGK81_11045 [Anaerolineae bacterium]
MNRLISYVSNWLAEGEKITFSVEDLMWSLKSFYPIPNGLSNENPGTAGCLVLTNRRLILLEGNSSTATPRWYSVTNIISLAERPPMWNKNWPYQAQLILGDGKILVLETMKDNVEQRGKALSALVVEAMLSLGANRFPENLLARYAAAGNAEKKQREDAVSVDISN